MPNELKGVAELNKRLVSLGGKLGQTVLRGAVKDAVVPVVLAMKVLAPRGKTVHRTYKGRIAAPGFLRRSIKYTIRSKRGVVSASIGVAREAFYGIAFLDRGVTVTSRRASKGKTSNTRKTVAGRGRRANKIQPYHIPGNRWFTGTFSVKKNQMLTAFTRALRNRLKKKGV